MRHLGNANPGNYSGIPRKSNTGKPAYRPSPPFRCVEGIESNAWKCLSRDAVWVLMEFYKKFNGRNRFNLSLTYKEVKGKISNGTFNKAIWELVSFGFLDVKRLGRLERNASIYGLSDRWKGFEDHPGRLDVNGKLLSLLNHFSRLRTPKEFSLENQKEFKSKRRTNLLRIRYALSAGGQMAIDVLRSLVGDAEPSTISSLSDVIQPPPTPPGELSSSPDGVENDFRNKVQP
jgi:hypothetical protein